VIGKVAASIVVTDEFVETGFSCDHLPARWIEDIHHPPHSSGLLSMVRDADLQ
jgi:hypothetical protein